MASVTSVLCFSELIKASDRNLVGNKGKFSVKCAIDDLHFVISPRSKHICRGCLGILKQIEGIDRNRIDFPYPVLATKRAFMALI